MSDRAFLFLFSVAMVVASLGAGAWLIVNHQAAHIDGLFLLLVCLVTAFSFVLYLRYLVRQAMAELAAAKKSLKESKSRAA